MVNEWLQHCGNDEFGKLAVNSRGDEIFSLDNGTVVKTEPELRMTLAAGSTAAMLSQPNDWVTFNDQNLGRAPIQTSLKPLTLPEPSIPCCLTQVNPGGQAGVSRVDLEGLISREIIVGYIMVFGTAG